jgi:hypothetical protein
MCPADRTPESAGQARDRLVRDEMRFLLERDQRRFGRQLRARLLEEGCNLPLAAATTAFYREMTAALASRVSEDQKRWLADHLPEGPGAVTHQSFNWIMRHMEGRLPDPGPALAGAALDAVAALKAQWRVDDACFRSAPEAFDARLGEALAQMARANPSGPLASAVAAAVRKRVQLALIASLLTYVRDSAAFEAAFGGVSRCLREIENDPTIFSRVMAFFFERIPYAGQLASQTFWRTLQSLDNEPI